MSSMRACLIDGASSASFRRASLERDDEGRPFGAPDDSASSRASWPAPAAFAKLRHLEQTELRVELRRIYLRCSSH